uniref:Uncharacterized protein n=1 Tax=Anopheles christyi TaxID=43041 RepID=A0A182KJ35_9DIPT
MSLGQQLLCSANQGERGRTAVCSRNLNHTLDQFVDLILTVTEVTALDVVVVLLAPAAGRRVKLDECTIVDLAQTEQLQNLADLRSNLVDTTDTNDKRHLRLGRDVDVALLLGNAGLLHNGTLRLQILLLVVERTEQILLATQQLHGT